MTKQFRPWSYSRLSTFKECKHQFWLKYVQDLPQVPNEHVLRGSQLHKDFETMINTGDKTTAFQNSPEGLQLWENIEDLIVSHENYEAEIQLAIKEDGSPCSFGDDDAFFRVIIDAYGKDEFIDWKFGRSGYYDKVQLDGYAIVLKAHYPDINGLVGGAIFPTMEPPVVRMFSYPKKSGHMNFEKLKADIVSVEKELAKEEWTPNTDRCKNCLMITHCEHYPKGVSYDKDMLL